MKTFFKLLLVISLITLTIISCKPKGCTDSEASNYDNTAKKDDGSCTYQEVCEALPPIGASSDILGYSILEKLPGIWNGSLYSPTPLGSYPEWIVDFRPISPSQISAKNELDSINDIFMSFFIVKHNNEYKIAFRNGGGFNGSVRNAYQVLESFTESQSESHYKFSDPVAGVDLTSKCKSTVFNFKVNKKNFFRSFVS